MPPDEAGSPNRSVSDPGMGSSIDDEPRAPWPGLLARLVRGEDLPRDDAVAAMDDIMGGRVSPGRMGAFLIALRAKGETAGEVAAAAQAMRAAARTWRGRGECVDIVGTGGDNSGTVNISTLAAIIVAACGVRVIKHGNRAATSSSGAADVLEALGLELEASPEVVGRVADEVGLGFAFAPVFHPAMRHAGPVRKELGVPTVFNVLGPLTNPASPVAGVIGCADERLAPIMAEVFAERGERMLVVRGEDGWDEITPQAPTRIWAAGSGVVEESTVSPHELGLHDITGSQLTGGNAAHNAEIVRIVLGLPREHPDMDIQADPEAVTAVAVANAAAALAAARAAGVASDDATLSETEMVADLDRSPANEPSWASRIAAEVPRAHDAVTSGAAGRLLTTWIDGVRQAHEADSPVRQSAWSGTGG